MILFSTLIYKRNLSNVIDKDTSCLLKRNNEIINTLSGFKPKTEREVSWINDTLVEYRRLQNKLKKTIEPELLNKFVIPPITTISSMKVTFPSKKVYPKKQKYHHKEIIINPVEVQETSHEIYSIIRVLQTENERLIKSLNTFNPNNLLDKNIAKLDYKRYLQVHESLKEMCPAAKVNEWYTGVSYKLALDPSLIPIRRARVMTILGEYCDKCGCQKDLEIHHVKWQSRGGTDVISNLQVLCHGCHTKLHGEILSQKVMVTA